MRYLRMMVKCSGRKRIFFFMSKTIFFLKRNFCQKYWMATTADLNDLQLKKINEIFFSDQKLFTDWDRRSNFKLKKCSVLNNNEVVNINLCLYLDSKERGTKNWLFFFTPFYYLKITMKPISHLILNPRFIFNSFF